MTNASGACVVGRAAFPITAAILLLAAGCSDRRDVVHPVDIDRAAREAQSDIDTYAAQQKAAVRSDRVTVRSVR